MGQSSTFIQHQPFQLHLLLFEFQLDKLPWKDREEDVGTEGRRKKCGKIKNELVFACSGKFLNRENSNCIWKPGDTHSHRERMRRNSNSDAASSSQVKLQDAYLGGLMDKATVKLVATEEESGDVDLSESETWSFHEEEVTGRPVADKQLQGNLEHPANQETRKTQKLKEKNGHSETVFSIVIKNYKREPADPMEDLDVNAAIWGIFLNTTLQAPVHLGQEYEVNLRFVKNHLWKSLVGTVKSMKLKDWSVIKQKSLVWKRLISKNLHGNRQAYCAAELIRSPTPKPNLLLLSALCGKDWRWSECSLEEQNLMCSENNHFKELNRIDGMQTEFEWKIRQVSRRWTSSKRFKIFYGRFSVWAWAVQRQDHLHVNVQRHCVGRKRKHRRVCSDFYYNCEVRSLIPSRSLVFLEKKWYGTYSDKPDGNWERTAEMMMLQLHTESCHPIFRASSAFWEES